jgi:coatomer subunit beta'
MLEEKSLQYPIWIVQCTYWDMCRKIIGKFNHHVFYSCGFILATVSKHIRNFFVRLYLGDKELNVTSFSLLLSVLEYQTAVMRRDFVTADRVLPIIPKEHRTRVAHFLEKQGFKQQALQVSTDSEHRFDLALQIGDLDVALQLARESDAPQKWSQLAEVATQKNKLDLVEECLTKANDFGGLLLLATSSGDSNMLRNIGENGVKQGKYNISFLSMFLLGDLDQCLEILIQTNRIPEAAFFARTYLPNKVTYVLDMWRQELGKVNEKAGQSLADPVQYENLFPGFHEAIKTQQYLEKDRKPLPAKLAPQIPLNIERNPIEEMRQQELDGNFDFLQPTSSSGSSHFYAKEKENLVAEQNQILENYEDVKSELSKNTTEDAAVEKQQLPKRKSSLDDFELEIDGINLDDNIDTSVSIFIALPYLLN